MNPQLSRREDACYCSDFNPICDFCKPTNIDVSQNRKEEIEKGCGTEFKDYLGNTHKCGIIWNCRILLCNKCKKKNKQEKTE
jgi:transposase